MTMPILHGVALSPFVRKVRVAMAEKSIAYEHVPVLPFEQTDEYRQKSPLGKIPCYEDGDFVLPDSSAIIAYLERIHPEPALYPADPQEFGRALWYEEYADTKLADTLTSVFVERFVQKNFFQKEPDEERVAEKLVEAEPLFDYLDGEIGDRAVMVGKHFSVADIAIGSIFVNFEHGGERPDAGRWPRLAAYVDGLHARPSFKGIIEEEKASISR
jgi:glutathione S-transferase